MTSGPYQVSQRERLGMTSPSIQPNIYAGSTMDADNPFSHTRGNNMERQFKNKKEEHSSSDPSNSLNIYGLGAQADYVKVVKTVPRTEQLQY